jgi:hypothetical protein
LKVADAIAYRIDGARDLNTWDVRESHGKHLTEVSPADAVVEEVERRSRNADSDLARSRLGRNYVFVAKNLRTAKFVEANRLHQ